MKCTRPLAVFVALMLYPLVASANHYADFYVIPIAGHTAGVNGTVWMSDVSLHNFQNAPLNISVVFVQSGEGNPDNIFPLVTGTFTGSVTVPSGGSTTLKDVLNDFAGTPNITGALLIGADRPFAVTSRTYNLSPSGDSYGQTVPAARDFIDNSVGRTDTSMAVAYIPGLVNNSRFRTNLGFLAGNAGAPGETMTLEVSLRDERGAAIGSTRRFTIAPAGFTQLQFSSRSVADRSFNDGSASFRIVQGSGAVVPYASVIDNRTADATFILGQFPPNSQTTAAGTIAPAVFRSLFEQMKLMEY